MRLLHEPPLDLDELHDTLMASRHVDCVTARVLCAALGRERTSKYLQQDANAHLLEAYGLGAVVIGNGDKPIRKDTILAVYLRSSLVGRLFEDAQLPAEGLVSPVAAEVADLERRALAEDL